jgi:hypothetical protein
MRQYGNYHPQAEETNYIRLNGDRDKLMIAQALMQTNAAVAAGLIRGVGIRPDAAAALEKALEALAFVRTPSRPERPNRAQTS